jgi:hypothetical protein
LFVLGAQRSGTNMLLDVLRHCGETEIYNETDPDAFANYQLRSLATVANLVQTSHADVVAFKAICDSQRARWLLDVFPDGKVLWIYRHYADVVNSALRQFKEHRRYLHYVLFEPTIAGWRCENLSTEDIALIQYHHDRDITDASARALIWYLRNEQFFRNELPYDDGSLLVRYECLTRTPAAAFGRVFDFLRLEPSGQALRRVSDRSVGRHQAPAIDEQIKSLCDDMWSRLNDAYDRHVHKSRTA